MIVKVNNEICAKCGICSTLCDAVITKHNSDIFIDTEKCKQCKLKQCKADCCPIGAISITKE